MYKPGERLPSLRALALDIHVSPNTVQRAYDELEREGTVVSRRGIGVFVADHQQLSAHGAVEKKTARSLNDVIRAALKNEISVDRLRSLFEHSLSQSRQRIGRKILKWYYRRKVEITFDLCKLLQLRLLFIH